MKSRIIGTGSCLPAAKVTNDWLSTKMDTSDEWIVSRTGIRERRIAREETTTDMAEQAARLALEDAGIAPEDLDLILVGTITADHVTPSAACELQARLGAGNAMALISMRPARDFCLPWRAQMLSRNRTLPECPCAGGGNIVPDYGLDGQKHLRPVRGRSRGGRGTEGGCGDPQLRSWL